MVRLAGSPEPSESEKFHGGIMSVCGSRASGSDPVECDYWQGNKCHGALTEVE